jgi:hypothetical protein
MLSAIAFYSMAIFVCVLIYRNFWMRSLRALRSRLRRVVLEQQTVDLPQGNYLFLRATGDEAGAVLTTGQSLAWLSHKLFFSITTWFSSLVGLVDHLWRAWPGRSSHEKPGMNCPPVDYFVALRRRYSLRMLFSTVPTVGGACLGCVIQSHATSISACSRSDGAKSPDVPRRCNSS